MGLLQISIAYAKAVSAVYPASRPAATELCRLGKRDAAGWAVDAELHVTGEDAWVDTDVPFCFPVGALSDHFVAVSACSLSARGVLMFPPSGIRWPISTHHASRSFDPPSTAPQQCPAVPIPRHAVYRREYGPDIFVVDFEFITRNFGSTCPSPLIVKVA